MMQTLSIISISLIALLILMPDRVWKSLMLFFVKLKMTGKLSLAQQEEYWIALSMLSDPLMDKKKTNLQSLKPFKFYLPLIIKLLHLSLEKGVPLRPVLAEIRHFMQKDLEFSAQVSLEEKGSLLQFFSLIIFVWIFVVMAEYMVNIQLNSNLKIIMAVIQTIGIGSFLIITRLAISRGLNRYDIWLAEIVSFQSLFKVGMNLEQCFPSNLGNFSLISPFNLYWRKLRFALDKAMESGRSMQDDIIAVKEELVFSRQIQFTKWQKRLVGIRLIWLFLFFFSSYLICIASLFSNIISNNSLDFSI